jgi:hypothetical protein
VKAFRALLAVGATLIFVAPAFAEPLPGATLSLPPRVHPGQTVTVQATGFPANAHIDIQAQLPNQGGANVATTLILGARLDATGQAAVSFRWPEKYTVCRIPAGVPTSANCSKNWPIPSPVNVSGCLTTPSGAAACTDASTTIDNATESAPPPAPTPGPAPRPSAQPVTIDLWKGAISSWTAVTNTLQRYAPAIDAGMCGLGVIADVGSVGAATPLTTLQCSVAIGEILAF